MSTITPDQQRLIAAKLAGMTIPSGLGNHENACSIAAINLALSGELTDEIPPCMSEVIGKWIIGVQDSMPDEIRNSNQWKALLPLAAGTGRDHEPERLQIVMDWMWGTVLPSIQPIADSGGYGDQWRAMTATRTDAAARAARAAAGAADAADPARAADAADPARAAVYAAGAAGAAVYAAVYVADAARAAARAAADAADAAVYVADAADAAVYAAARAAVWTQFNPCGLLQRLIED